MGRGEGGSTEEIGTKEEGRKTWYGGEGCGREKPSACDTTAAVAFGANCLFRKNQYDLSTYTG